MTVAKTAVSAVLCLTCLAPAVARAAAPTEIGETGAAGARVHPFQRFERPLQLQSVRVTRSAEGRRVILNETPVERARRFATGLLPVPDLPGLPSDTLEPLIRRHCDAHNLDPRLVRAVIQIESGYNRRARSNKGAMGLMQLMPETAIELAVHRPYDADENLRGGTTYLRQLIDAFTGNLELALAAYNAGPGAVERHRGVPPYPDTLDYVARVMALYRGGDRAVQWQWHAGHRPPPHVIRGANGRLLVTTSLTDLR